MIELNKGLDEEKNDDDVAYDIIALYKEKSAEEKIAELNSQMQKAIEEQNFEQAAVLRDEIKSLKGEN